MRYLTILLCVATLLLPIAFAETEIFSGKVITDTEKVIDGGTFKFLYDDVANKVFVQTPSTNMIIDNGACEFNPIFKICINSANFTDRDPITWVNYYELDVDIYKLTGSLATDISSTSDKLLQSEPLELKILIANPTNFDISNIVFNYDLTQFLIKEVEGCSLDGKKISWSGNLKSKYDKECKATLIADEEGTHTLTGSLTYFNGYETETKTTSELAITVSPRQLHIDQSVDKDVEINQPFFVNMSLQNLNKEEQIYAVVTIEVPSNIAILKSLGFLKDANHLKLITKLEPSAIKNYSLYLEAKSEGNQPIKQKFDYSIKTISDIIQNDTFINLLAPKPIIDFTSEYSELLPGQKFVVVAKLNNPSKIHGLTDIKATLNSSYSEIIEQRLDRLMPNESYIIISNILITPKTIEEISNGLVELNLNVEYKFGEVTQSVNKSLLLIVKEAGQTVATATTTQAPTNAVQAPQANTNEDFLVENDTIAATITQAQGFFEKETLRITGLVLSSLVVIVVIVYVMISIGFKKKAKKEIDEDKLLEEIELEIKQDKMK